MIEDYSRVRVARTHNIRWDSVSPRDRVAGDATGRYGPFTVSVSVSRRPGRSHSPHGARYHVRAWLGTYPGVDAPRSVIDEAGTCPRCVEAWPLARRLIEERCNAYLRSLQPEILVHLPGIEGIGPPAGDGDDAPHGTMADDLPQRVRWIDAPDRRKTGSGFGLFGRLRVRISVRPDTTGYHWIAEIWAPPRDLGYRDLEHASPSEPPDHAPDDRRTGRAPGIAKSWRYALLAACRAARSVVTTHPDARIEWTYGAQGPQSLATRRWRRRHQRDA